VDKLTNDFGTWRRHRTISIDIKRLTGDIAQNFNYAAQSIPVPFTSSKWGSLASFGSRSYPGTKERYGTTGSSFVAAVEFGPQVHAKAVTAGGESADPKISSLRRSAGAYAAGNLRDVYFYKRRLEGHIERQYHPASEGKTGRIYKLST